MRCFASFVVRFPRSVLPILLLWLVCLPTRAQATVQLPGFGSIERYTLANGMRVVLNPIPDHPTVGVCMTYRVGSADEVEGQSGYAHLFEHLMFQGTRNVASGDHFRLLAERGGRANATTTQDQTSYYTDLPSGQLALALWLEADRQQRLSLARSGFESQRDVVLEEYRKRYTNRAYRKGLLRLHELVFQRYWPYEHPTIGYRREVVAAEFDWAKQFYEEYYGPNNAVLSIAGGFDPTEARALIEQYFAPASVRPRPESDLPHVLPRQTSERLSVIVDHNAKRPGVFYGWRIPEARTPENRALVLAARILAGGETGLLKRELVLEGALANRVSSFTSGHRGPDAFNVFVQLASRATVDAMQKRFEQVLNRLRIQGPSDDQVERARQAIKQEWLTDMQRARNRARALGKLEALWGDATEIGDEMTAYDDITRSDVRAAAAKYLIDTKRSIVEVYPPGWVRDIGPPIITKTYIVEPGDNLTRIAARYGTTPEAIAKQNGFGVNKRIVVGQRLLVTTSPSKIVKQRVHTVKKGDTLIGIGKKYGVSAKDIASANGFATTKSIRPGQELRIPTASKTNASKGTTRAGKGQAAKPALRTYVVRAGDSLSVIARRHGVSVKALTAANNISEKKPIRPGQKLTIPESAAKNKK